MNINQRTINLLKSAHEFFINNPEKNAYFVYRSGDEKYLDYVIEKDSWYRGSGYHLWESGVFVSTFDPEWINELCHPKENTQNTGSN